MREIRNALETARNAASPVAQCAAVLWLLAMTTAAPASHACDPIADEGWRVTATEEVTGVKDSAPHEAGGDWVVERTTTLLPLCNYFTATGQYSLRSYSLDPYDKNERVAICHAGTPVKPYTGRCPPE
jgi:hypothetical protein